MILSLIVIMLASLFCILTIWWVYNYAEVDVAIKALFILLCILSILLFWVDRLGLF